MRNLKRALSLVMATAMLLGMMVIGAGAVSIDDFADKDDIVNKDAVALMVDLGIIEGTSPTSFSPNRTLERAAVAKLAYYVLMGDADETLYNGMGAFTDVDGKTWAEGYINYCKAAGLIDGVGGDRFNPTGKLTVTATAKVLLTALGWDAEDREYTGNNYSIAVTRDANRNGLMTGVTQKGSDTITRDTAALMFYNALFAPTVEAQYDRDMGEKYVSRYNETGETLGEQTYGLTKVTGTVTGFHTDGTAIVKDAEGTEVSSISKKFTVSPEMVGSAVVAYTDKQGNLYSSALAAGATKILASSTNGTTITNLTDKAQKATFVAELDTSPAYYLNGETSDASDTGTASAKKGVIVDLIDTNGNGKANIVRVTEKTVKTLSADPVVTTAADGSTTVAIADVLAQATPTANVKGYEGLKKGDVVLTVEVGGVTYIEKATSVEGVVTGKRGTAAAAKYTIAGTAYGLSGLVAATVMDASDFTTTCTFYLDNGGNIIARVPVEGEAAPTNYAVVLQYGVVGASTAIGAAGATYQAQLLYMDGSTEVVEIDKFDNKTIVSTAPSGDTEVEFDDTFKANTGIFVSYVQNPQTSKYALATVASPVTVKADAPIKKGVAAFATKDGGTDPIIGNANTLFVVYNSTTKTFTPYTGIANVPAIDAAGLTSGVVLANEAGIATHVYLVATALAGQATAPKLAYILSKTDFETVPNGVGGVNYVYDAIVDGKAVKLTAAHVAGEGATQVVGAEGLVTYVLTSDLLTNVTAVDEGDLAASIGAPVGGIVKIGDKVWQYSEDTVVYTIDEATGTCATGTASGITAAEDGVSVYVVDDGTPESDKAAVIYIIKTAA